MLTGIQAFVKPGLSVNSLFREKKRDRKQSKPTELCIMDLGAYILQYCQSDFYRNNSEEVYIEAKISFQLFSYEKHSTCLQIYLKKYSASS